MHSLNCSVPSAMFTPLISSSTVTVPSVLQSPGHGVGDGVDVSDSVAVGDGVSVTDGVGETDGVAVVDGVDVREGEGATVGRSTWISNCLAWLSPLLSAAMTRNEPEPMGL